MTPQTYSPTPLDRSEQALQLMATLEEPLLLVTLMTAAKHLSRERRESLADYITEGIPRHALPRLKRDLDEGGEDWQPTPIFNTWEGDGQPPGTDVGNRACRQPGGPSEGSDPAICASSSPSYRTWPPLWTFQSHRELPVWLSALGWAVFLLGFMGLIFVVVVGGAKR